MDSELPDSRYLKSHSSVCRVAHFSGAAGHLDLCDRVYEERPHVRRVMVRQQWCWSLGYTDSSSEMESTIMRSLSLIAARSGEGRVGDK